MTTGTAHQLRLGSLFRIQSRPLPAKVRKCQATVWQMNSHQILRSRAKMIAFATVVIFVGGSVVIRCLSLDLGIVRMLSRFTAHFVGIPSSGPSSTSTGISRVVRVTMATVTEVLTL